MTDRARILLVEDDPAIARALARRLAREPGLVVESAHSLASALATRSFFDVAIIDLHLPDGSGLDVHDALVGAGLVERSVFFSATTSEIERNEASRLGAFVSKDAGIEQVVETTLRLLTTSDRGPPQSSTRPSSPHLDGDGEPAIDTQSSGEIPRVQITDTTSEAITKTK